ncbi:hypothetical protein FE257_003327 [Aspergillus nanangensis]|uniref:Ubiquitin-like protease family profile domain-containing protein n=1 Tax=Aspergillus nanangensis TaxID=2582783 RepID=A0AAD4CUA8_ASPNN|nr:hypothetical protein FE257_003327 [Aspergillus nanangensis]
MSGVLSTQKLPSEREDMTMQDISMLTPQEAYENYPFDPMDISPIPIPAVNQNSSQQPSRPRFVASATSPTYGSLSLFPISAVNQNSTQQPAPIPRRVASATTPPYGDISVPLPRILSPITHERAPMTGPLTRSPYIRPLHRFSPKSSKPRARVPIISSFLNMPQRRGHSTTSGLGLNTSRTMPSQNRGHSTTSGLGMPSRKVTWPAPWNASSSRDSSFNSLQTDMSALSSNKPTSFESVTSLSTTESSVSRKRSIDDGVDVPAPSLEADSRLSTKYRRVSGSDFPESATLIEPSKSSVPPSPPTPAHEINVSLPTHTPSIVLQASSSPTHVSRSTHAPSLEPQASTPTAPTSMTLSLAHRRVPQFIPGMWLEDSPALVASSPAVLASPAQGIQTPGISVQNDQTDDIDTDTTSSYLYNTLERYSTVFANSLRTFGAFARRAIGYLQQRYRGHPRRARASPIHPNLRSFSPEQRRRLREQQHLRERGHRPVQDFPFPDISHIPSFPTVASHPVPPNTIRQLSPPDARFPLESPFTLTRRSSRAGSGGSATRNKYFKTPQRQHGRASSPTKDAKRSQTGRRVQKSRIQKQVDPVSPKVSPSIKRRIGLPNRRNPDAARRAYMLQRAMNTSKFVPSERQLALMATAGDIELPKRKPKKHVHFGDPIAEIIHEHNLFTELAPYLHPSSPNVMNDGSSTIKSLQSQPVSSKPEDLLEEKENVPPSLEATAAATEETDDYRIDDPWTNYPYLLGRPVSAVSLVCPNPRPIPPGRTESLYAREWEQIEEEKKKNERPTRIRLEGPAVRPLSSSWENRVREAMAQPPSRKIVQTMAGESLTRRDLATCFTPAAWLNDEVINAYMDLIIAYMRRTNGNAGRHEKPRFHAFNSFFFSNLRDKGYTSVRRWATRAKIGGKDLLNVDTVFIPVHNHSHWTLIVVKPLERTIENFDSLGTVSQTHISIIKGWLRNELGDLYLEDEWTVPPSDSPQQNNGSDCGAFLLCTAKSLAISLEPLSYNAADIPLLRRKIVAELMARGLEGEFDPLGGGEPLL